MYDTSIAVGDIRYRDRGRQIISYSKLMRHRGITPTDIDGFIDYGGNGFILMEAKIYGKEIDYGQKLAFENLTKSINKKPICTVVFRHDTPSEEDIQADECYVDDYYANFKWGSMKLPKLQWHRLLDQQIKLLDFIERVENFWKSKGCIL